MEQSGTKNVHLRYRPIRVGWCVDSRKNEDLDTALLWSHLLWGGRYNPIVPIDDELYANRIIKSYKVDALYWVNESDDAAKAFVKRYPEIRWRIGFSGLFTREGSRTRLNLLDVSHAIRLFTAVLRSGEISRGFTPILFTWESDHPLRRVFRATFGELPANGELSSYLGNYLENLHPEVIPIGGDDAIHRNASVFFSPNAVSGYKCSQNQIRFRPDVGVFIGNPDDNRDLISFWNLRAAGHNAFWWWPTFQNKLEPMINRLHDHVKMGNFGKAARGRVWVSKPGYREFIPGVWQHDLVSIADQPLDEELPIYNIGSPTVIGHYATGTEGRRSLTIPLLSKPFNDGLDHSYEHLVVSVENTWLKDYDGHGFALPFFTSLNSTLGHECVFDPTALRLEPDGAGVLASAYQNEIHLREIEAQRLVELISERCGFKIRISHAGRIAERISAQIGRDARVFRIEGVRRLLSDLNSHSSISYKQATEKIRDRKPGSTPGFEKYRDLYIQQRDHNLKLTEDEVWQFLVSRKVFLAGLNIKCPHCELPSWLSIAEVADEVTCTSCGAAVNVSAQVSKWTFKRTGLFGKEDAQQGAIPVLLTRDRIVDAVAHHYSFSVYQFGTELEQSSEKCELDALFVVQTHDGILEVCLVECKSEAGFLTKERIEKMKRVADRFSNNGLPPYLLFSRLSEYKEDELAVLSEAREHGYGMILWEKRHLESLFFTYDEEESYKGTVISFSDLVHATDEIYFKSRKVVRPPPAM